MIGILVTVLVVCLIFWAARELMRVFEVPAKIQQVAQIFFIVFVLLWLLSIFPGSNQWFPKF